MSRADKLNRLSADACGFYNRAEGPVVLFDAAADIIRELEAALAARDKRIAELIDTRVDMAAAAADYDRARAEVPEWCREFMAAITRDWDNFELLETAARVVNEYADQLNACGIEAP
jgi:hypothetical protein